MLQDHLTCWTRQLINGKQTGWIDIIEKLRQAANLLKTSHRSKAETEQASAKKSLIGDVIGIGGVLLAPFSGGLSLVAAGASVLTTVDSYLSDNAANKKHEENAAGIKRMIEEAEELDKIASDELNSLLSNFDYLEEKLCSLKLGNVMTSLEELSLPTVGIKVPGTKQVIEEDRDKGSYQNDELSRFDVGTEVKDIKNGKENGESNGFQDKENESLTGQGLTWPKFTDFSAIMNCVDQFVSGSKLTKEVGIKANPTKGITSWTKSISTVTTESKTVSNVNEARKTIKTVITKTASHSHKVAKTTEITTKTVNIGKVSHAATKAAKISKVGLVINAVALPFDIYNLVKTTDNLDKMQDDVEEIEERANQLEEELENICNSLLSRRKCIEELHRQLYKLYEDRHNDEIFDYLLLMYEKLDLDTPVPH